jgi:hypothetical protein
VINKRVTTRPIGIANPNGSIMYSTHEADLDLPSLPLAARRVHIVPALQSSSLLSMGQLCDAGCRVTFDAAQSVNVHLQDQLLLTGARDHAIGPWHLGLHVDTSKTSKNHVPPTAPADDTASCPLAPPLLQHSYAAMQSVTPAELVACAHAALFSPALSTLAKALERGFLPQCIGLTSQNLRKYPPQSVAMVKGHLDQTRKNQRSTKKPITPPTLPLAPIHTNGGEDDGLFPTSEPGNARTHARTIATPPLLSPPTAKFIPIKPKNL